MSGNYAVVFQQGGDAYRYKVRYQDQKVSEESFCTGDGKQLFYRGEDGVGQLWYEEAGQFQAFQVPESQLVAVSRQDNLQHKFLAPLDLWAKSTFHYAFGKTMGQDTVAAFGDGAPPIDRYDEQQVIALFKSGVKKFGGEFTDRLRSSMRNVGYEIEEIGLTPLEGVRLPISVRLEPEIIYVKEQSLPGPTQQFEMSSGMFRSLALLIHITFSLMSRDASLILIDDIGEGLDFGRSTSLIKNLVEQVKNSDVQLIMSTNDRFVMNAIPLQYWAVISRDGSRVVIKNYNNSRAKFDKFRFTGMNNFEFFATDFIDSE